MRLRHTIQNLIDGGIIETPPAPKPNVITNVMPPHNNDHAINQISLSSTKEPSSATYDPVHYITPISQPKPMVPFREDEDVNMLEVQLEGIKSTGSMTLEQLLQLLDQMSSAIVSLQQRAEQSERALAELHAMIRELKPIQREEVPQSQKNAISQPSFTRAPGSIDRFYDACTVIKEALDNGIIGKGEPAQKPEPRKFSGNTSTIFTNAGPSNYLAPTSAAFKKGRTPPPKSTPKPRAVRGPRQFAVFPIPLEVVMERLLALGHLTKPGPIPVRDPPPPNCHPDQWCEFHEQNGHRTNNCMRLRHTIQDLIDGGIFKAPLAPRPNVIANVVNHISLSPTPKSISISENPFNYIPTSQPKPVVPVCAEDSDNISSDHLGQDFCQDILGCSERIQLLEFPALQSETEDEKELLNEEFWGLCVTRAGLDKKADAEAETEAEVFVSE
jgi:hypothetical protein